MQVTGTHAIRLLILVIVTLAWLNAPVVAQQPAPQNWTHTVRIAAHPLTGTNSGAIVADATRSHVFGIEVDNDIPGRYESFLDPTAKLAAIRDVAAKAHAAGNRSFVYVAGWECITAHADQTPHTLAKDHPDWVQRKITGEPANFTGGAAFWIDKGDEDVWISPYAAEWRAIYMERIRQIAATGIDGIYVDVPYWMTHFDGWEDSWASFDDYTLAAFKTQTGLDARRDVRLGDFSDPGFQKWVAFRIRTITDFMREVRTNARSVNPDCMTIAEIYPGIEEEVVRVGADVYELYQVVDAIGHEYEFGGGDHMASSRQPFDWLRYMTGMYAFRAFAEGRATWILNYSWDGDKKIDPRDAMLNLFSAELTAGVNVWDARGHVMSGSNDMATRTRVFAWIAGHEKTFYRPREAVDPVGLYFSPETRNASATAYVRSFQGMFALLLQKHVEVEVVTPRTLARFRGRTLVLPGSAVLDDTERNAIGRLAALGCRVVVTGANASGLATSDRIVAFPVCPGSAYFAALEKDFDRTSPEQAADFLRALAGGTGTSVAAPKSVVTQVARVDGRIHVFLANFTGLRGGVNARPTPVGDVRVSLPAAAGKGYFLPFLGTAREVAGRRVHDLTVFSLPPIDRGGVFWFEPAANPPVARSARSTGGDQ